MSNSNFVRSSGNADNVYIYDSAKTAEHDGLEVQHHVLEQLMFGRTVHAPVSNPNRILDIGCGTGATTIRLAKDFPNAQIIGVDQSPIPPIHQKPANVEYIIGRLDDLVSSARLESGSFDLVFARYLVLGVQDWGTHMEQCYSLIASGGYLECHEPAVFVHYSATSMDKPVDDEWSWPNSLLTSALKHLNVNLRIGERLHDLFKSVSPQDVKT